MTHPTRRVGRPAILVVLLAALVAAGACAAGARDARRGMASWYGDKYHGRKTASGEVFDMRALTAAHRTLPFGTRVRVTDVSSGRTVVVRINDRFPGTKGRIIDLSKAAFARIAPLERGVITVTVQRL